MRSLWPGLRSYPVNLTDNAGEGTFNGPYCRAACVPALPKYGKIMTITVNQREIETAGPVTVAELLRQQEFPSQGVAVAVDNRLVPRTEWERRELSDGAKVTVIRAVCGG